MQLYLIRHAESENNAKPVFERVEDPPLTARGRLQAELLGKWSQSLCIDRLITSPFLRTLQTTRRIVDRKSQQIHIWHDVFERGGCFRGHLKSRAEGAMGLGRGAIAQHVTDNPDDCIIDDTIAETGWWGGRDFESDNEAITRSVLVIDRLIRTFGTRRQTVVIVTHADFKSILLESMLGRIELAGSGPIHNTAISKLNFDGDWNLDWLNAVDHLPARLVTSNTQ